VQASTVADDRDRVHRHLLAALDQALRHPGEVIDVLSGSEDDEAGYAALQERFGWDENQARAFANIQFRRVTRVHRDAIARDLMGNP
jgi:DNA gyrase/topoisomerase IV subunit A